MHFYSFVSVYYSCIYISIIYCTRIYAFSAALVPTRALMCCVPTLGATGFMTCCRMARLGSEERLYSSTAPLSSARAPAWCADASQVGTM